MLDYHRQASQADLMHPNFEHLLPWFVAVGAGAGAGGAMRIHARATYGDLAMKAQAFAHTADRLVMDAKSIDQLRSGANGTTALLGHAA
jgi:4,5-DOPA dioxygenase extradiol